MSAPRQLDKLRILTGNANPRLAADIAQHLGLSLSAMTVSQFSDQEIWVKIEESVRGTDCFVIQPTCPPTSDTLMELLIIVDALKRASARRIVAVIPYYGYARQEKKIKPREPITAKLVADLITVAGANRLLAVDLHTQSIQGFFNMPVDHLPAGPLLADYFLSRGLADSNTVVVSPDVGGVAAALAFAERLKAQLAIIAKRRPAANQAETIEVIGDLEGQRAIMIDDMIDTAGSIAAGAQALVARGAAEVYACATHAVLSGNAVQRINESPLREVILTDTIPLPPEKQSPKIHVLSVAPMLAEAICRVHDDASVSAMFAQPYEDDRK